MAGFFSRLKGGLSKTRDNMVKGLDNVFSGYSDIDGDFYDDLEETLIMGDIGVNATSRILDKLRSQVEEKNIRSTRECRDLLIQNIREQMHTDEHAYDFENQKSVLFIIGVNGVGKTTSVGKLASIYKNKGKKVLVAAADTYRAAATEQLEEWANRAGVPLVKGVEGADPASVIFDAVNSAKAKDIDILIVDTAGRLHNKKNLMEELRKMNKILDNHLPDYKRENLIVLDGTTGQNAMSQAREFGEVTDLTGIILTKMDGTSKGGIAVAIVSELNIPVKYIGVGESLDDLERFEPQEFVDALFDIDHEERVKLDQEIIARKLSSGEMDSSQLTEEEAIDILTRH
nr:signal recognition particle-docking protein FtsY [Butyrivibrio fibrisolvens]